MLSKTKVPLWPGQAKTELLFLSQREVLDNVMCHPVYICMVTWKILIFLTEFSSQDLLGSEHGITQTSFNASQVQPQLPMPAAHKVQGKFQISARTKVKTKGNLFHLLSSMLLQRVFRVVYIFFCQRKAVVFKAPAATT